MTSYDEILVYLGEFGRHQRLILVLLCGTGIACGIHVFSGVFLLAQPLFRCALPGENGTEYSLAPDVWRSSFPLDKNGVGYSKCEYLSDNSSVACSNYIYDNSVYSSSAVTEWNLVCDRSWLVATNQSLLMVGILLGSIFCGQLSDKVGRKPVLMAALLLQLTSGVLTGIAPDYVSHTIARMLVGCSISGVYLVAYVLATEMVGPRYRLFVTVCIMVSYSVGAVFTSAFAYLICDWHSMQIAMSLPGLLFLAYNWIVPESTRWLLSKQDIKAAITNIERTASINSVTVPLDLLETLQQPEQSRTLLEPLAQPTLLNIFKYPNMRRKSLQIFFNWFVITVTYYGLSWNTNLLGNNVFRNYLICSIIEIPAYCSLLLLLNRLGRRVVLCANLMLSGVGLLFALLVPQDMIWLYISSIMFGKFCITAAYGVIYIFTAEQFPTVVRNVGLGSSSMVARVGGILTPFIFMLSQAWPPMPLVICGVLAILGGSLALMLPETSNKPTLETLADGEKFGRKLSSKAEINFEEHGRLIMLDNQFNSKIQK